MSTTTTKMQVSVRLDQRLSMSQQLRQAISLLQYNTIDLKQVIQQYIDLNPMIDVDEPEIENDADNHLEISEEASDESEIQDIEESYEDSNQFSADSSRKNQHFDREYTLENVSAKKTLRDYLMDQTLNCHFSPDQAVIAEAIIDAIDENGYLTMELESIKDMLATEQPLGIDHIKDVLSTIQTFDPIGIGASNIRECLLLQLNASTHKDAIWKIAYRIVDEFFDLISSNNTKSMIKKLGVDYNDYSKAMTLIRSLDPHPGTQYSSEINVNIEPELYVKKIKDTWQVYLVDSILTNVKINHVYQDLIRKNRGNGSYSSLRKELDEARGILKGLKRRNETLLAVGSYIIECQKDFLDHGLTYMKPMNFADVSQALEIHESTVSRITTGKYIATPRGVFELKFFFPSHVSMNSGDTCSATAVKAHIKDLIDHEKENHVLSDEEIAVLLKEKGINIARRTIAKYREALHISPSYQRMRVKPGTTSLELIDEKAEVDPETV